MHHEAVEIACQSRFSCFSVMLCAFDSVSIVLLGLHVSTFKSDLAGLEPSRTRARVTSSYSDSKLNVQQHERLIPPIYNIQPDPNSLDFTLVRILEIYKTTVIVLETRSAHNVGYLGTISELS